MRLFFLIAVLAGLIVWMVKSGVVLPSFSASTRVADPTEHYDDSVRAGAAKVTPVKDPIQEEINAFRLETRQLYNNRRFADLEARAQELRASKALFRNGSWKIAQFHDCLECKDEEPESMWQLHDQIHRQWIAAYPQSVTARVAHAKFFSSYAWYARGSGFADTVTEEGWKLFRERLAKAREILQEARKMKEKDPVLWIAAMVVALGEAWPKPAYDTLVEEAVKFEPKYWGYHTTRAYSLLPRWHGQPGDWEAYADQAAARPDGLGLETYARIVIRLRGFHDHIFEETKASWPKTRDGLALMRKRYPDSLEILSQSAFLAAIAQDRTTAQPLFHQLGDAYLSGVWRKPERFVHCQHWAETGEW